MQPLDLLILNSACDDWENLTSIRASVESDLNDNPVDEATLEACLLHLVWEGLVDAHEFSGGAFVRMAPDAVKEEFIHRFWYFVTPAGRQLLDANEAFFDKPGDS